MNLRFKATVVAGLALIMTAVSAWAATPVKLVDTPAHEEWVAVADGWLGWSSWDSSSNRFVAWLDPTDGAKRRIPTRRSALVGGIILDGPRAGQVGFWQYEGEDAQIKFYDLATKEILNAPAGINTNKAEESVSGSGDHLLFGRGPLGEVASRQILLSTFSTGKTIVLDSADAGLLYADQVNGGYAVYTEITKTSAQVYRYRISNGALARMPVAPKGRANYYSAVLPDGTVFYVEGSASACGINTKIMRFRDGKETVVALLGDGIEVQDMDAQRIDGAIHLVFSRFVCATGKGGIYEIVL